MGEILWYNLSTEEVARILKTESSKLSLATFLSPRYKENCSALKVENFRKKFMEGKSILSTWWFWLLIVVIAGLIAWAIFIKPKAPVGEVTIPPPEIPETRIPKLPPTIPAPEGKIIVKQFGGAGILQAECADRSYITDTADYIIEGRVEKVESKWNEERTSIFTFTDLGIEKYVKGTPFREDKLQIVTPGGRVGEIEQWVEDQPIFHADRKVRIYFKETNGEFSIVCGWMGVEEI